jgi:hypothetical protein
MEKVTLFLLAVFCLSLAGCSRDSQVQAFITELDATTKEMVGKIEASPDSAGMDEAQKVFDAKKALLKERFDAFKNMREFQISDETKKQFIESANADRKLLGDVIEKNRSKISADPAAMPKFQKLMNDFGETFKMK